MACRSCAVACGLSGNLLPPMQEFRFVQVRMYGVANGEEHHSIWLKVLVRRGVASCEFTPYNHASAMFSVENVSRDGRQHRGVHVWNNTKKN